jgi:hypothetical protein
MDIETQWESGRERERERERERGNRKREVGDIADVSHLHSFHRKSDRYKKSERKMRDITDERLRQSTQWKQREREVETQRERERERKWRHRSYRSYRSLSLSLSFSIEDCAMRTLTHT